MKKEKKEKKEELPKYYDLQDETVDRVNSVIDKMSLPFKLKTKMIGVNKQKQMLKIQKASPVLSHFMDIDLVIYVNEENLEFLDETSANILIHQELDRLEMDIEKGTIKIGKFRLQTNEGILNKYGIEAVAKANQLSELVHKQKKDADSDDIKLETKKAKKQSVEFDEE